MKKGGGSRCQPQPAELSLIGGPGQRRVSLDGGQDWLGADWGGAGGQRRGRAGMDLVG